MSDRAIDASSASGYGLASERPRFSLGSYLLNGAIFVVECLARAKQRRALSRLDDRMLSDIGVSRADVEGELSKPFWRA